MSKHNEIALLFAATYFRISQQEPVLSVRTDSTWRSDWEYARLGLTVRDVSTIMKKCARHIAWRTPMMLKRLIRIKSRAT